MVRKRMQKLEGIRTEIASPETYPSKKSDIVLVGWGSTYGAMKEAVDLIKSDGISAQMIHFSEIFPFTARSFLEKIKKKAKVFAVENNYNGQFADIFARETGISIFHKILKYDGRPFAPQEIVAQVKDQL
jgi:2-oxoglutarate ferredoxin oxidoreductase subunit alpha